MKPITPVEAGKGKGQAFPDEVIAAFNDLIRKYYDGKSASFHRDEVVELMVGMGISKRDIDTNNWLGIEGVYGRSGWKVERKKSGSNESETAIFTFTKKKGSKKSV